jgi:hypothetical protein
VDEPRPQPPASEAPFVNGGRNEAARQEAAHANALDDENGRERSLFDDADSVEPEDEESDDAGRAGDVERDSENEPRHRR